MNYLADNLNYFVVSEKHTPIPINEDNFSNQELELMVVSLCYSP